MPTKTVIENHKLYVDHPSLPEGKSFIELLYYPNSHAYKLDGEKLIGVSGVIDTIDKIGLRFYYMNEAIKSLTRKLIPENDGTFQLPTGDVWTEACKEAKVAHNIRSDRGKDNGTKTHTWLEGFLTAKRDGEVLPSLPEPVEVPRQTAGMSYEQLDEIEIKVEYNNLIEALSQFVHFCEAHQVEVVELERLILSLRYKYAGRFDAILRIDGKLYMVDFKTNNPTAEYPDGIFPEAFVQIGGYDTAYTEEMYPELDKKNQSAFDGHLVLNFSKKTGKLSKRFLEGDNINIHRQSFVHTLGTKRCLQHLVRTLSMRYKENRTQTKKKGKDVK